MLKKSLQAIAVLCFVGSSIQAQCPTPDAGPDQSICAGSTLTFEATLPNSFIGTWTKGNPGVFGFGADQGTIADAANPVTTVTNLNNGGTQLFIWTIDDGASCTLRDTMMLTVMASPTVTDAGNDIEVCLGGTATLSADAAPVGSVGVWSKRVGVNAATTSFADDSDNQSDVTGFFKKGTDTLRWTVTNTMCGGSAYADVQITVNDMPSAANAGLDQQACLEDTIQLGGNPPSIGDPSWQILGANFDYFTENATGDTIGVSGTGGDLKFAYKISNGNNPTVLNACLSVDTVMVNFGPLADAGTDFSICSSTATLDASALESGETGLWSIIKQSGSETIDTPASPTSSVSGVTSDTLTLRWTVTKGSCSDYDEINIYKLGSLPTPAVAGADIIGCAGDTVTLYGSVATSGVPTWTRVNGGFLGGFNLPFLPDGNNDTIDVRLRTVGDYKLYYTIAVGGATKGECMSRDSLEISVNAVPTASAGADQSSCTGVSTYTVTGNNPGAGNTGTWTKVSGKGTLSKIDSVTSVITGVTSGTTILAWTVTNGVCSDVDNLTITVGTPTKAVAGADVLGCAGDTIQLIGSKPSIGTPQWTYPDGGFFGAFTDLSFVPNGDNDTVSARLIGAGTYKLYYTISVGPANIGDACTSVDSLEVTVVNPTANAGADMNRCTSSITMNASALAAGETGKWTFVQKTGSEVIVSPTSPTTSVTGVTTDTLILRWTVTNGNCSDSDDVNVFALTGVTPPSTAVAGTDVAACVGDTIQLVGSTPSSGTPQWSYPGGGFLGGFTDLSFVPNGNNDVVDVRLIGAGTYTLLYTITTSGADGDCVSRDEVVVSVEDCVVGIDEPESKNLKITVYPNPATDIVTVSFVDSESSVATISIVSTDGRVVVEKVLGSVLSASASVDISELPSGVYILRVIKGDSLSFEKLIVH